MEAGFGDWSYAFLAVALADGGLRAGGLARASCVDRQRGGHRPYLGGCSPGCGDGCFPGAMDAPAIGSSSGTARLPAAPAGHLAVVPPARLVCHLRVGALYLGLGLVHPGSLYLGTAAGRG